MIYSFVAAILWSAALIYLIYTLKHASPVEIKYNGKTYVRRSEIVPADIKSLVWNSYDGFSMKCNTSDGAEVHLDLPKEAYSLLEKEKKEIVPLRKIKLKDGFAYSCAPIVNLNKDICVDNDNEKSPMILNPDNAEIYQSFVQKIYLLILLLMCASFITLAKYPFFAICIVFLSYLLISLNIPFLNWTKDKSFCIIRVKGTSSDKKEKENKEDAKDEFPMGYQDWSDTEKDIYKIEAKVNQTSQESSNTDNSSDDEGTDISECEFETNDIDGEDLESLSEDFSDYSDDEIEDFSEQEKESEEESLDNCEVCKKCGVLIPKDSLFCPYCGNTMEENSNNTSEKMDAETAESDSEVAPKEESAEKNTDKPPQQKKRNFNKNNRRNRHSTKKQKETEFSNIISESNNEPLF